MVTTAQMNKLLNVQNQLLGVMKDLTPVIEAQAKAMDGLGESSKKAEKDLERVESGLGKFINNTIRAQKGFKGGMHRLLYGVDGYFHFKNTMDATLSIVDKFIVRPLSGLKDKDDKQGAIGRMMFGLGGSYRKTQQQAGSFFSNVKEQMGSMSIANLLDPNSPFAKQGYKSPAQRGLGNIKEKFLNSKAIKFYNTQNKMKVFNDFLRSKGKGAIKIATSSLKVLGTMGLMAMKYFIIIGLALTGVFVLVKLLKKAGLDGEKLKEIGLKMWAAMKVGFGIIWDSLIRIWDGASQMLNGIFGDGDLTDVLVGWFKIVTGLLGVVLGVAVSLVWPLLTGIWEIIKVGLVAIGDFLFGKYQGGAEKMYDGVRKIIWWIGVIAAIIGIIFGAVLGWPVVLGGLIMMGISLILKKINPFAAGGVTKSGMSLVGEKGPELVRLPTGSRVHSNRESRKMISTGGGNNITVNVQGRIGASDSELRQIAQKVGQMINKEINRTTSSRGLGA